MRRNVVLHTADNVSLRLQSLRPRSSGCCTSVLPALGFSMKIFDPIVTNVCGQVTVSQKVEKPEKGACVTCACVAKSGDALRTVKTMSPSTPSSAASRACVKGGQALIRPNHHAMQQPGAPGEQQQMVGWDQGCSRVPLNGPIWLQLGHWWAAALLGMSQECRNAFFSGSCHDTWQPTSDMYLHLCAQPPGGLLLLCWHAHAEDRQLLLPLLHHGEQCLCNMCNSSTHTSGCRRPAAAAAMRTALGGFEASTLQVNLETQATAAAVT